MIKNTYSGNTKMKTSFSVFIILIVLLMMNQGIQAQGKVIKIWPSIAPGSDKKIDKEKIINGRAYDVFQPDLRIFLAGKPDKKKAAVLIFPGGGYSHVTLEKEGVKVADWLNKLGISAFVLKYRLNRAEALADAKKALELIRSKSKSFNINPSNIGVMGFSAGGHLAINLEANCKDYSNTKNEGKNSATCKADFIVLAYPQADSLASKEYLTDNFPPTFIVQAADDRTVPIETSVKIFNILHSEKVPVELHIFEKGGHGFGLGKENQPLSKWTMLCKDWMIDEGIISKAAIK